MFVIKSNYIIVIARNNKNQITKLVRRDKFKISMTKILKIALNIGISDIEIYLYFGACNLLFLKL